MDIENMNFTEINVTESTLIWGIPTNKTSTRLSSSLREVMWTTSLVGSILLSSMGLWLVIAIAFYGFKTGKFYQMKKSSRSERLMLRIMFLGAVLILPRLATTNALVWFGWDPSPEQDLGCEIIIDISVVVYFLSLLQVGIFLWFRQRYLYLQPSLQRLHTCFIKVISWGCIVFLSVSGGGFVLYLTIPQSYRSSRDGCVAVDNDKRAVYYVITSVLVLSEFLLISLFVYPLYRHTRTKNLTNRRTSEAGTFSKTSMSESAETSVTSGPQGARYAMKSQPGQSSTPVLRRKDKPLRKTFAKSTKNVARSNTTRKAKTEKKVLRVMRRSVVSACVCVLSDVLAFAAVALLLPAGTLRSFRNVLYDVNLIVNVISLVFSFANPKRILFSFLIKRRVPSRTSFESSRTSGNDDSKTSGSSYY